MMAAPTILLATSSAPNSSLGPEGGAEVGPEGGAEVGPEVGAEVGPEGGAEWGLVSRQFGLDDVGLLSRHSFLHISNSMQLQFFSVHFFFNNLTYPTQSVV